MYGMPVTFKVLGIRADMAAFLQKYVSEQNSTNPLLTATKDILNFANSGSKSTYEYILNIFLKPGGLLLTIAFSLIAIYLITGMIDTYLMTGRDIDIHVMIKMFCTLVLADILIEATPTIISYILGGSVGLLNDVITLITDAETEKAAEDAAQAAESVNALIDGLGLLQLVFASIWVSGLKIVNAIPTLGLKIILFSTQLEIIIRLIFAPIGLAGFANESHRHEATRYLRKMIASGIYAAAIYITIFATLTLSKSLTTPSVDNPSDILSWLTTNVGNVAMQIIGPFAAIGAISTVKGLINEALGA